MTSFERIFIVVAFLSISAASSANADSLQTGAFTASFTTKELLGEAASQIDSVISQDEALTWEVYVPPGYRSDSPAGLLVYISPMASGALPRKWDRVMDQHNLIWISANRSGNRVPVPRRILLATLSILVAERSYAVDSKRVFISGFSGGGKVASTVAASNPNLFSGGIFIGGAESSRLEGTDYFQNMNSNRYVFLTGSKDKAYGQTRLGFRAFRDAGVEHTKFMVVHGMNHRTPEYSDLAEAIEFLDSSDDAVQ
jgi:hypothetical protein